MLDDRRAMRADLVAAVHSRGEMADSTSTRQARYRADADMSSRCDCRPTSLVVVVCTGDVCASAALGNGAGES